MESNSQNWAAKTWNTLTIRLKHCKIKPVKLGRPLSELSDFKPLGRPSSKASSRPNSRAEPKLYELAGSNDSGAMINIISNDSIKVKRTSDTKASKSQQAELSASSTSACLVLPVSLPPSVVVTSPSSVMLHTKPSMNTSHQNPQVTTALWKNQPIQQQSHLLQPPKKRRSRREKNKRQSRKIQAIEQQVASNTETQQQSASLKMSTKKANLRMERMPVMLLDTGKPMPPMHVISVEDSLIRKVSTRLASVESLKPVQASIFFKSAYCCVDTNVRHDQTGSVTPLNTSTSVPEKNTLASNALSTMDSSEPSTPPVVLDTQKVDSTPVVPKRKWELKMGRPIVSSNADGFSWAAVQVKQVCHQDSTSQSIRHTSQQNQAALHRPLPPLPINLTDNLNSTEPITQTSDMVTSTTTKLTESRNRASLEGFYEDVMKGEMSFRSIAYKWINSSQNSLVDSSATTETTSTQVLIDHAANTKTRTSISSDCGKWSFQRSDEVDEDQVDRLSQFSFEQSVTC
ncbi:hypothetical protein MT418_007295 [Batrachochytrium dendrobatidis]